MRLPTLKVLTHSGKFHPDELFACAMLAHFKQSWLKIKRSRSEEVITNYREKGHYIIDVGDVYNPPFSLDHHQKSFNKLNKFGNVMSSCGIMWEELKKSCELTESMINKIDEFVNIVDMHDNGVKFAPELEYITLFNYSSAEEDKRFMNAFRVVCLHFANLMQRWKYECINEREHTLIVNSPEYYNSDKTVIAFNGKLSITEIINSSSALLVVYKRSNDECVIQSLNAGIEVDFSVRCPAPDDWLGKSSGEVDELPELVFCHKGGFITVVKTDIDNAVKIAETIVQKHNEKS